jgi:hypothetical protein
MNPGAVDSYLVSGSIVGFSTSEGYEVSVTADGTETTFETLVDSASTPGDDSTGDSGGSPGQTDDDTSDADGDSPDAGSDTGPELQRLLLVDGTNDPAEIALYDISVSGDIERDEGNSSVVDGGLPWDSMTDFVEDGRVIGNVGNGTDGFRFTGTVQTIDIDGDAGIRIVEP